MCGVSAKRLTANGNLPTNCRIQSVEEGWNVGTDVHPVEFRTVVNEVTVARAHAIRQF